MHNYEKVILAASYKDDKDAISYYSYAIKIDSKNPKAFYERGVRYSKIGMHIKGINDINTAIQKRNKLFFPACYLERGKIYLRLEKYKYAKADFINILFLEYSDQLLVEKSIFYKGITNLFLNKSSETLEDISLLSNDLWNWKKYLTALRFSFLKEYDLSLKTFEELLRKEPKFFKNNIELFGFIPLEMKFIFKTTLHF